MGTWILSLIGSLGGRKLLVTLLGILATWLHDKLGIPADMVNNIGALAISYVLAQGLADGLSKGATSTLPGTPGAEVIHGDDVPESVR
jgi:hypothetical protein